MPPPGGLADKIGNRYEGRIAIGRLLQLLDDQHDSVLFRLEQPGDDSFEWWVQSASGSRTYTQVKRQQSLDEEWTIKTLVSRGVIPAFGRRLAEEPDAHCEFFSALSASHLQQLSDDARTAGSLQEFEKTFVAARNKKASWDELRGAWKDATPEQAWRRLRRVSAGNTDEESLRENLRAHARALVNAPPGDVVARLGDFLDDHLAAELTADEVWAYLREKCGFRPTDWSRDQDVHHRVHDETARYRTGIAEDRAPLTEIRRSAAGVIADLLAAPGGPQVITVTAGAGDGKSALLGQVLEDLQARAEADPGSGCPQVVLATRLDRLDGFRDAQELGTAMRLPGPPAAVLSRVAAGRPALLVLDQVDAFGTGSGRNPARLEAVTEALREARALGIKAMIACRAFDLEVDDRLALLAGVTRGQPTDGHHVERLGPLPDQDVDNTLRAAGIDPATLTPSLRRLLSTPLPLRMLVMLQERGRLDPAGITTRLQLFDKFYAAVLDEAEARQPGALVTQVSDRLALLLSEQQDLSVGAARLSEHPVTVNSLVRAGWLRRDGGRIAFAHEAFFDYAYAQQHMRSGRPLLSLLRSGEQHLFRRAQVRQILALEREQEREQYLADVRDILAADDIRPHLKELVTALVTLVPDPGLDEWEALSVLGDATTGSLAEQACWLAAQAPGFSRLLLDKGIISGYLAGPGTAELGTWMCTLMARSHPDEVACLLRPYTGQDGWAGRLVRVLNAAPLDRSDQMVTLMTAAIDAGALDDAVRHPSQRGGDFFTLMHTFKGESAASGTLLVAAWLRRRLALLTADGAYNQSQEPTGAGASSDGDGGAAGEQRDETDGDPASTGASEADETVTTQKKIAYYVRMMHEARARLLLGDSMSAPEILAALAAGDPVAFSRNILPVVRQASAASRTGRTGFNGERDEAFGEPPEPDSGYDANQALLVRLAQAVQAAAGLGDPVTLAAVRDMAGSALATEQLLAAAGFASGHPDLLSDAAGWLQASPYAFEQGWYGYGRNFSAQVLARVCTGLPAEQTRAIQERAAAYSTSYEAGQRHQYGRAAWQLLYEVPDENLTEQARARKAELRRKFPPPVTAAPAPAGQQPPDPSVLPPITADEVRRMSDANLVNAMRRWSSEDWQPQPDGRLRGGATSFAQVITAVSSEDPSRLTAVLETLPSSINPLYTTHILLGLRQSATPEQSLRAAWAARAQLSMSAVQIGQLIERAAPSVDAGLLDAAGVTEHELLELLRRLLDQAPSVLADTAQSGDDSEGEEPEQSEAPEITGEKIADKLLSRALNRPEYPALRALALLAPAFSQAAALLATELSRLADSPALAVRALVIELSLTQFNADPDAVAALPAKAIDSGGTAADPSPEPLPADPRLLLASSQLRNLLLRLCWARYDIAEPVVARMIAFFDTATAEDVPAALKAAATQAAHNAAMVATAAACKDPVALALTQRLAIKQLPFRRGITAALARLLPTGEVNDELASVLADLFDDPDDDLARLAGHVLAFLPLLHDDLARRLLSAACHARTFTLEPSQVINAADQYQGEVSGTVVEIAERFFELHHSQARDLRGNGGHAASILGRLVIRIYARETRNPALAARTLNLIDAMVLARSYGLEDQLALLDR
ncbi:MAG TPA: hypothetical protein VFE59_10490 [Trebonia sp.]|nr:hypothetical protein [Trebonia sp.]